VHLFGLENRLVTEKKFGKKKKGAAGENYMRNHTTKKGRNQLLKRRRYERITSTIEKGKNCIEMSAKRKNVEEETGRKG